jgi:hypothetical protein
MYNRIVRQPKIPDFRIRLPYTYPNSSAFSSSVIDARALQIFKFIVTSATNANILFGLTL